MNDANKYLREYIIIILKYYLQKRDKGNKKANKN